MLHLNPFDTCTWIICSQTTARLHNKRAAILFCFSFHWLLLCFHTEGLDVIFTLQGDPSLFVASAASQLLVHMLTLSVESESTTPLSEKDCDWPACAQMIIKHIEDSLQSGSASHISQSLKLLTSLFGSCRATWTEVLWLRIAKQVESFLTEDSVQTRHMLADLLLNMSRWGSTDLVIRNTHFPPFVLVRHITYGSLSSQVSCVLWHWRQFLGISDICSGTLKPSTSRSFGSRNSESPQMVGVAAVKSLHSADVCNVSGVFLRAISCLHCVFYYVA